MELIRHLRKLLTVGLALVLLTLIGLSQLAAQQRPYTVEDLKKLAQAGVTENRFLDLVRERGISFATTPEAIEDLRASGVPEAVLKEISAQIPLEQGPDFYLREGDRLVTEGHFEEAIAYYKKILEQLPDDPGAKARIARAEQRQKNAAAEAQRHEQEEKERIQLPYFQQQLRDALQASHCATVVLYATKILSAEPGNREAEEALSQCFQPYTLKQTLSGHQREVYSVAFSPDGHLLASGSGDNTIKLWEVASGALRQTLGGHQYMVESVAFSPDGRRLASGSEDGTIKLWDVAKGTLKQTLSGHSNWVLSVAFSPDGRLLASGSMDKTIKLWDAASGVLKQTLGEHEATVQSVVFSPDGRLLASGGWDGAIKLWDVASRGVVASGSFDNTIKLWDVLTGAEKQTLSGHQREVYSVAFSPDGRFLASGSNDNTIKLWERAQ
jgi:WD40 repeat protein